MSLGRRMVLALMLSSLTSRTTGRPHTAPTHNKTQYTSLSLSVCVCVCAKVFAPSGSLISSRQCVYSSRVMKPVSGVCAPFMSISRSHTCRSVSSIVCDTRDTSGTDWPSLGSKST